MKGSLKISLRSTECWTWNQRFIIGLSLILIRGNILSLDFLFSRSKASDANVGIIANFVLYGKTRIEFSRKHTKVGKIVNGVFP